MAVDYIPTILDGPRACCGGRKWCLQLTNKGRYLKCVVYEFDLAEPDR